MPTHDALLETRAHFEWHQTSFFGRYRFKKSAKFLVIAVGGGFHQGVFIFPQDMVFRDEEVALLVAEGLPFVVGVDFVGAEVGFIGQRLIFRNKISQVEIPNPTFLAEFNLF